MSSESSDVAVQTIVTSELALEPLVVGHAEEMFELLSDAEIYRHLDYPPPPSIEHLRAVYARLETRRSHDGSQIWLNWAIRPRGEPPVGYVQATVGLDRSAYVAYVLASKYWRRGYAQMAVRAMLEHLASVYAVDRYLATVEAANQRSIRLLECLGFRLAAAHESNGHRLSPTERMFVR